MSYDWYENLMVCRENQTEWLADLFQKEMIETNLPGVILGKCFKKETNLTVGSPSILMKNILDEKGVSVDMFDPWIDKTEAPLKTACVFFIGTNHDVFLEYEFPNGSIIIDPWRFIQKKDGIKVIQVGNSFKSK
jgi:UDPglucose 6-dehydrogenase